MSSFEVGPLPLLSPHAPFEPASPEKGASVGGAAPFSDLLEVAVMRANGSLHHAEDAGRAFAEGRSDDIHGTMIALSEANIELRTIGSVKNKIVDAFYELWRMQA